MRDRRLSTWAGGLVGVAAAAALTLLLRQGSRSFQLRASADIGSLTAAVWLLALVGVVLAAVLWSARLHPLIVGVPGVWFLVCFGPILAGSEGAPGWYPEWLGRHVLTTASPAAFVITGLLAATSVEAIVRRGRR